MNKKADTELDPYRSLLLMTEIEKSEQLSQRELSTRLGVALGLVNSYLKNFVSKGYVRVKAYPRNRYAYLLTPTGFAEKSRLALQHLSYFTSLYTTTRKEYLDLFLRLKEQGVDSVVFCGIDEVAEIAYLSLQEAGLELTAVADDACERSELFGRPAISLSEVGAGGSQLVVTSLKRREHLCRELVQLGVAAERIHVSGEAE